MGTHVRFEPTAGSANKPGPAGRANLISRWRPREIVGASSFSGSDLLAARADLFDDRGEPALVDDAHPARRKTQRDETVLLIEPVALGAQIDLEPTLGLVVRVAHLVADEGGLAGYLTDSGHG